MGREGGRGEEEEGGGVEESIGTSLLNPSIHIVSQDLNTGDLQLLSLCHCLGQPQTEPMFSLKVQFHSNIIYA